jgi:hypothetical protein
MPHEALSANLIEIELRSDSAEAGSLASRARSSANGVRFLRSIYVPVDDRWVLLYEGAFAEEVAAAARRADTVVISIAQARGVAGEIPELTDVSASTAREAGVRPRQLLKVDKKAGPGRVDANLEEDR